jgi:predicted RNA polymerase sigma factor
MRKQAREHPLPPEEPISGLSDAEQALVDRVDEADSRDDILRLLFVCCHPDLPATRQIALALRREARVAFDRAIAPPTRPPGRRISGAGSTS